MTLLTAVETFAHTTHATSDAALNTPWAWQDYASEGVRFAFFRVYETLQTLAVQLATQRAQSDTPQTPAQRILSQYHAAYCDLQAICFAVTPEIAVQPPDAGEWAVRRTLAHILGADLGFYGILTYVLQRHRQGLDGTVKMTEADWDAILGLDEQAYRDLLDSPFEQLQAYHRDFHVRILETLADIQAAELDLPATFWEEEPYPLRFRLHRFDSHTRQHTLQIEKSLIALGHATTEAHQLLRHIYAALAAVEGVLIGAADLGAEARATAAAEIMDLASEVGAVLA